jgi:hypothetical protein
MSIFYVFVPQAGTDKSHPSPQKHKSKKMASDEDDYDFKDVSIETNSNIPPMNPYTHPSEHSIPAEFNRHSVDERGTNTAARKRTSHMSGNSSRPSSISVPITPAEPDCEAGDHYLRDSVMSTTRLPGSQQNSAYNFEPFSNPRPAPLPPRKSGSSHGSRGGSRSSVDTKPIVPSMEHIERGHRPHHSTSSLPSSHASSTPHAPARSVGKLRKTNPFVEAIIHHGDKEADVMKSWRYEDFEPPSDSSAERDAALSKRSLNPFKGILHKRKHSAPPYM